MDETSKHYQGEAGRHYHEGKRSIPSLASPWVGRLRRQKIEPWIRPEDVVLEYGVGYGWNLAGLPCRRRLGFDVSEFLEPFVREQGVEWVADLASVPSSSTDVVLCHHTLEHLAHPTPALLEMRRLLVSGGRLLLFVPFERERRYRRYRSDEPNHHLFSWNVQTLGNLVREAGFQIRQARVGRFGYDRFAARWACQLRAGEIGFRLFRAGLHCLKPAHEVRLVAQRN